MKKGMVFVRPPKADTLKTMSQIAEKIQEQEIFSFSVECLSEQADISNAIHVCRGEGCDEVIVFFRGYFGWHNPQTSKGSGQRITGCFSLGVH